MENVRNLIFQYPTAVVHFLIRIRRYDDWKGWLYSKKESAGVDRGSRTGEIWDRNRDARPDPYDHFARPMTAVRPLFPDQGVGGQFRHLGGNSTDRYVGWTVSVCRNTSTMWAPFRMGDTWCGAGYDPPSVSEFRRVTFSASVFSGRPVWLFGQFQFRRG